MEDILPKITPHSSARKLAKGATLLYQSEIPRHVYTVSKGLIRAYSITSSGEERTISLHSRGDIFPLSWLYGETSSTLFYYDAVEASEVLATPKKLFLETINSQPETQANIMKHVVKEHTAQQMRITALEQATAIEKISLTLYYLMIRHGRQYKPGYYTLNIKLTHTIIASLVGLTRESTALHMSNLKKSDVVSYKGFIYTIHKPGLERFISEDSFKNVVLR